MNYRLNTKAIIAVGALCVLLLGFFVYTLIQTPTPSEQSDSGVIATTSQESLDMIITAKHQYKDGIHTIAGKATLPTSCHRLIAEPFFVGENSTSSVEIRFSTLLEGETCPSEAFDAPFSVTFEAGENVTITALWNGKSVRLNLIPLKDGETLEGDAYIKG